jgi:hypothetical protein
MLCREQVTDHLERLLERVAHAPVQVVLQVVALDVFHDQEGDVAVPVGVVHADDVGMLQPGGGTRLGAKTGLVFGRRFFRQVLDLHGLDGDPSLQVGIASLVHDSHGALAEDTDQVIAAKLFETHNDFGLGSGEKPILACAPTAAVTPAAGLSRL